MDDRERRPIFTSGSFDASDELRDDIRLVDPVEVRGLTIPTASFFIVGQVAGAGIVSIANAFADAGFIGILLLILTAVANIFVSVFLTRCYYLLAEKDDEFGKHVRDPYTNLIGKALGEKARVISSVLLHAVILSTITIYLLIAADIASNFIHAFDETDKSPFHPMHQFRTWVLIFALIITPLTLFGTPKEFWGIALLAFAATILSFLFLIIRLIVQHKLSPVDFGAVPQRLVTWRTFFSGLGTILFAMTGVPLFPALLADMRVKKDFSKAVLVGYIYNSLIYLPLGIYGFILLGDNLKANILTNSLELREVCHNCRALIFISQLLLGIHFVFGYLMVLNPIAQEVEEYIGIPRYMSWQRFLVRSSLVLLTLLIAEIIPNFGIAIYLVGGTLTTILSYILPALAYLKLDENISLHMKVLLYEMLAVAVVICIGTLYSFAHDVTQLY